MKYKKKQKRWRTEKITQNQILIHPGVGGSQSRGRAAELKQAVNRQCTYALAEYVSG
jgi:hypothetical protein